MNAKLTLVTVMLMLSRLASAAPAAKLFDVTLEDVRGVGRMLNVGFYDKLPLPEAVDKIVRESLELAILVDPTIDILATGFLGDDVLDDTHYSGSLVYHSSTKQVLTMDEDRGVVRTSSKTAESTSSREEINLQTLEAELEKAKADAQLAKAKLVQEAKADAQLAKSKLVQKAKETLKERARVEARSYFRTKNKGRGIHEFNIKDITVVEERGGNYCANVVVEVVTSAIFFTNTTLHEIKLFYDVDTLEFDSVLSHVSDISLFQPKITQ